jgi:glycosyltransferase involved in cell wall biosynthesis
MGQAVAVMRNGENKGFVRAVNQGMRFSDSPYVCIMNNDTITTDGWLDEMIDILRLHGDVGMVNPSSNTSCQFPGNLSIDDYAGSLKAFKGRYQELYTGRAFAMVVRRDVIRKIGYLDESYGMGYFDDTDYCKRAQRLGYKAVRSRASYVYHMESQSFSRIKEKDAIFLENERTFAAKWGRCLRVAYIVAGPIDDETAGAVSSNINKIVRSGHQVWVFTPRHLERRFSLIDHEGIRFLSCPRILFNFVAAYKIWKRSKKKNLHVIVVNGAAGYAFFKACAKLVGGDIFMDTDLPAVEKRIAQLSRAPSII